MVGLELVSAAPDTGARWELIVLVAVVPAESIPR